MSSVLHEVCNLCEEWKCDSPRNQLHINTSGLSKGYRPLVHDVKHGLHLGTLKQMMPSEVSTLCVSQGSKNCIRKHHLMLIVRL